MFRFTIRDVLWLTVVVALAVAPLPSYAGDESYEIMRRTLVECRTCNSRGS